MYEDDDLTPMEKNISEFLKMRHFALFGASDDHSSLGYRILQNMSKKGYKVYPINPRMAKIDRTRCYGTLDELPVSPQVIVVSLPPEPAMEVVKSGAAHGIRRYWFQPGSESDAVLTYASENGLSVVYSECLLDELGKR